MNTRRFRHKSTKSSLNTLKKIFGIRRHLSQKEKNNYLNELREIYNVIKQHKHSPDNVLTVEQMQAVSPDYIMEILNAIQKRYNWSLMYSVPPSENKFLKAVIRIANRILDISDTIHNHTKQIKRSGGLQSASSTSIFEKLCTINTLNTTKHTLAHVHDPEQVEGWDSMCLFAPSDECMNQPFYKNYFESISDNIELLQTIVQHHFVPIDKLLNNTQFTVSSALGYPITIVHKNQYIEKVNHANILDINEKINIYTIDSVLGVYKPFGLTVFQKKVLQKRITSICMLFSKHYCTSPCTMGTLTCSYAHGGMSSVRSDMNYFKHFVLQSLCESFIMISTTASITYAILPLLENVFGNISLVDWSKSFTPLLIAPILPISITLNQLRVLYFPVMQKLTGVTVNMNLFSTIISAPVLEELIFRGGIKKGIDTILKVYPPPKQQDIKTKRQSVQSKSNTTKKTKTKLKSKTKSRRRRSSSFEDLLKDEEVVYANRLSYWATSVFVSLWFSFAHIINHTGKDQSVFVNRWATVIQVVITFIIGSMCHVLTTERNLLVSILRHAIHNFIVVMMPNINDTTKLIFGSPPIIRFQLPANTQKWSGVQTVIAFYVNRKIEMPIQLIFPYWGCKPHQPIQSLGIRYKSNVFNSTTEAKIFEQTISLPKELVYPNSLIEYRCVPTEQEKRGY